METRIDESGPDDHPGARHPRWLLSAMVDGEADAVELRRGLAAWDMAEARQCWHAYHLIGDVLRSEDLASAPRHDHRFLQRLCARLDDQPDLLLPKAPSRRRAWLVPAAVAAGVMGLATVLVLSFGPPGGAAAPMLAVAPAAPPRPAAPTATAATSVATAAPPAATASVAEAVPPGGRLVRDAQLDSYLRAHRDYATALPGSLPGGSGRSIATVSLDR